MRECGRRGRDVKGGEREGCERVWEEREGCERGGEGLRVGGEGGM